MKPQGYSCGNYAIQSQLSDKNLVAQYNSYCMNEWAYVFILSTPWNKIGYLKSTKQSHLYIIANSSN